jgi:hypothetical protein
MCVYVYMRWNLQNGESDNEKYELPGSKSESLGVELMK